VPARLEEHAFFGDFVLNGEARLGEVGQLYGFQVAPAAAGLSVAEYIAQAFHHRPVVGDRVRLGQVELVVRDAGEGGVTRVGLKFLGIA
jgi:potassium/hydrogen antiporter